MDIHHLSIFVAVYRQRSFSRAAQQINLSQPTLTEHIKNLEAEIGRRLFDRAGRKIFPTPEADLLYEQAVNVLDAMQKLYDGIAAKQQTLIGPIRVGASTIPGTYLLPVAAAAFRRRQPEVSFEIVSADSKEICDRVISHDLMMGAVGALPDDDRLDSTPLFRDRLVLAARPDLWPKETMTLRELAGVPMILREEGSGTRRTFERFLQERDFDPRAFSVTATVGSTEAVRAALLAGLGFSVISNLAVAEEIERGRLKEITLKGIRMARFFHLVTHRRRTLPLRYQAFREFLSAWKPED